MSARASVAFITDQVEEVKQRQFVDLVPGIVQVRMQYTCKRSFIGRGHGHEYFSWLTGLKLS